MSVYAVENQHTSLYIGVKLTKGKKEHWGDRPWSTNFIMV